MIESVIINGFKARYIFAIPLSQRFEADLLSASPAVFMSKTRYNARNLANLISVPPGLADPGGR